ncbi:unnamed protein product [Agarophyton chilense]|eukprot:gb/GEZJ01004283.1/.p1 GENE.gb/GEZJ01004283.1/~~gb/GEZJ01004283.1/.p1  ORF type:complete len:281 (-),score=42.87 gb/GEZJ01004283.1/:142-984(-)
MAFVSCFPLFRSTVHIVHNRCETSCNPARRLPKASYNNNNNSNQSDPLPYDPPPSTDPPFSDNGTTSSPVIDATARSVPLQDLKLQLLSRVSTVNRGFAASPSSRQQILSLVEQIERENPTPLTARSELLDGDWKLLYTNALDVLSLGLLSSVTLVAEVFQNVQRLDEDSFSVVNVVNFEPPIAAVSNSFWGRTMATLVVNADGKRSSDTRIDIRFKSVKFKPVSVVGFQLPDVLSPPPIRVGSPKGYIETTFLDDDIRIARAPPTNSSNLFVLQRVDDS